MGLRFGEPEGMMAWRRGKAYAQDLRERVLVSLDAGMAAAGIAALFKVSVSYVYKVRLRRLRTGETTARPQRCRLGQALAPWHEAISAEVAARPDATLDELRAWLLKSHGVRASQGGMWNALDRLGLTLKKRAATRRSRSAPTSPPRARLGVSGSRA
jgi:transposase